MSIIGFLLLSFSTVIFIIAAMVAKTWGIEPTIGKLVMTLALYSLGNLVMLRLVRDFGMSVPFSLSAVVQLIAINLVAILYFGEKLSGIQGIGVGLAVVAVSLITLGPALASK